MSAKITITKLAHAVHAGDWHDAPLKWAVNGPLTERQLFATKRDAILYRRLRRAAQTDLAACEAYIQHD